MKRNFYILFASLFLALTTSVMAASTLFGPTGLIMIPTAESLKYKEVNFAVDYTYSNDTKQDVWYYKANLGTFQSWELGVVGDSSRDEGLFLNAKYYLMSSEERNPVSVAIGLENLSSKDQSGIYMVASKKFEHSVLAHFGFRARFESDQVQPSVMGGFEYLWTEQTSVLADIDGQGRDYIANAGVRFNWAHNLTFRASVLDLFNTLGGGSSYSLGLSLNRFL